MTSTKPNLTFLLILSALMACTSLSTDIYLPALPTMEKALHGNAELTVTGFLIGFAIAQLVWGPISDRIGRKIPLYIGTALFAIGSIGCAMSDTMESVVFWRVFQALGACVGPMLSRTMIRDLYDSTQAAQMLSTLVMIMAVAPIVAPLLGGLILKFSEWHMIFMLMAVIGGLLFCSVKFLPETLPAEKRSGVSIGQSFANYAVLLKNKRFMVYTLCVTFFYVAVYAFITGSSFVYITYFGVPEQYYGFLFGINILGITLISAINRKLVMRFSLDVLLHRSTLLASAATVVLMALVWLNIGGLWGVALPILLMFSMNGIIAACSNAAALASVDNGMAGSAAALIGSLQYGSGIVSSLLLAWFSDGTPHTMAWIMTLFVVLSAVMAMMSKRQG